LEIFTNSLGNTYFWQGRYREAIEQYQRYIQVAKSDFNRERGYAQIAHLYYLKGDIKRSVDAINQSVKHDKRFMWMPFVLAFEQGKHTEAEKYKKEFLSILSYTEHKERGFLRLYNYHLGIIKMKEGKTTEGIEHFKEALRHHAPIWNIDAQEDCLANAYLQTNNLDGAITEYERILQINPNYPLAYYYLAQAFERKGEGDKAKTYYEQFLRVWNNADADVPEVITAKKRLL